jgi:hypothetical protein
VGERFLRECVKRRGPWGRRRLVSDKVSLLATDESKVYRGLTAHETVHHAAHQYVVGAVHTQTIEGFWSIFKRCIVGPQSKRQIHAALYCRIPIPQS